MATERMLFELYSQQNIFTKFHIKTRYKRSRMWELESYLPKSGWFLDIGCGHGLFSNLLALSSNSRNILGIDISDTKISIAKSTVGNRVNINFLAGDIYDFRPRTYPEINRREGGTFSRDETRNEDAGVAEGQLRQERVTPSQSEKMSSLPTSDFGIGSKQQFDAITFLDVLYLISFNKQEEILSILYSHLKEGGILLINEICKIKSIKFYKALLQEHIAVRLLKITAGNKFYYRTDREWEELLAKIGFLTRGIKRDTPNPTTLYICKK